MEAIDYVRANNITARVVEDHGLGHDDGWERHSYIVEVTSGTTGATMQTPWLTGKDVPGPPGATESSVADIVHSVITDAAGTIDVPFEEWARDAGYDTDSRKAEKIYHACQELLPGAAAIVGGIDALKNLYYDGFEN